MPCVLYGGAEWAEFYMLIHIKPTSNHPNQCQEEGSEFCSICLRRRDLSLRFDFNLQISSRPSLARHESMPSCIHPNSLSKCSMSQEKRAAAQLHTEVLAGPWLGPAGSRPLALGRKPMSPDQIMPGVFLAVKTRIASDEGTASARCRSPIECCRVQETFSQDLTEFGELTLVPVEFLFAVRYEWASFSP